MQGRYPVSPSLFCFYRKWHRNHDLPDGGLDFHALSFWKIFGHIGKNTMRGAVVFNCTYNRDQSEVLFDLNMSEDILHGQRSHYTDIPKPCDYYLAGIFREMHRKNYPVIPKTPWKIRVRRNKKTYKSFLKNHYVWRYDDDIEFSVPKVQKG